MVFTVADCESYGAVTGPVGHGSVSVSGDVTAAEGYSTNSLLPKDVSTELDPTVSSKMEDTSMENGVNPSTSRPRLEDQ
jgi:hypothetical protein